ncbi:uncharacterized protein [Dendrobates tinctorius]|uniref:uncharacterized protein n=1 Tax=Dendrobates tinctorius TaxID=92724 RepID=UPI003CC99E45
MDFRARDQSWLTRLNEVFKDESPLILDSQHKDTKEQTIRLKNLLLKRTKLWWNKAFLEKYLSKGLIPRGLRIQLFPAFPIDDVSFRDNWKRISTRSSKEYMELLVQLDSTKLGILETEIEAVQLELKKNLSPDALTKFQEELDGDFTKWEQDICKNKSQKFQRDVLDFQDNRVYRWKATPKRDRSPSAVRSDSMSSFASAEESRQTSKSGAKTKDSSGRNIRNTRSRYTGRRKVYPSPTYGAKTKPKGMEP